MGGFVSLPGGSSIEPAGSRGLREPDSGMRALVFILCLVFPLMAGCSQASLDPVPTADPATPGVRFRSPVTRAYGKLPLGFEVNHGQASADVLFLARGNGYTLFLGRSTAALAFATRHESDPVVASEGKNASEDSVRFRMRLVGADRDAATSGSGELPGMVHYFVGNDPNAWRTDIPTYAAVRYEDVYPGIDQVYYGSQGQIEYDFVVAPGADPDVIRIRLDGSGPFHKDAEGNLGFGPGPGTDGARIRMLKPVIYQMVGGERREVSGEYVVFGQSVVGFRVGSFDRSRPLVIDPVLSYSTFLAFRSGRAVAADSSGNAYVTGLDGTGDAFVAKLNASGSALVYTTSLGSGSGGVSIAVDGDGNAYVTGQTNSTDFPTTTNAFQRTLAGARDIYVSKLDASGSTLLYSTYLGGEGDESAGDIAVDGAGNVYLTGTTGSRAFPTENPLNATFGGDAFDAFVTKLNASGSALLYSTYLGGDGLDLGLGIAVDLEGNAYVTGQTRSGTFPTVNPLQQGSFLTTVTGDAFVSKLDASGSRLIYSTFFGGRRADLGAAILADSSGNAYVVGWTASDDFLTQVPYQEALVGFSDAFVSKFNPSGSALLYSTFLGGNGPDTATGIALDTDGNVYVTGDTASTDFPTVDPLEDLSPSNTANDAYLSKLSASGSELLYSTYFGGTGDDDGLGISIDGAGNVYLTGRTDSTDFPTASPLLGSFSGSVSAFVFRVAAPAPVGRPFTVVDRGGTSITSAGSSATLTVGHAEVGVDGTAPSGVAIFGLRQNGVLVSEAGVPASTPRNSGRIHADVSGAVNTGIAMANPHGQVANISFFFTGADGVNFGEGSFTLGANQQIARFLNEAPFGEAAVEGAFTFISDVPVVVVALRGLTNERGEFLITTLPVADVGSTSTAPLFFPHFADGGGWTTQIVLVNPSDATIGGTLEFFDPSGSPVDLGVEGEIGSSFVYAVSPRTSRRFLTSGSGSTIRVGAAKVSPSSGVAPSGLAVFSFRNNNTTVSESGVPALTPGTAFRMYAEASGTFGAVGSIQTGVAVANPSSTATTLLFELSELAGTSSGLIGTATVPGQGQIALFLNQIQGFRTLPLPFAGVLRISTGSASGVSVVGLRGRYNERGDFLITTTTPVNESGTPTSTTTFFPHLVDGNGYTTQFILFSGMASQSTSGTLRFFKASGEATSVPAQ